MPVVTSSDISIASNALLLLGHEPISSFEEPTVGSTLAANLYFTTYNSMLTHYRWRFASKKAKLARLSTAPLAEYTYKYQLPADMLYMSRATTANLAYEIYGDTLHTNATEVIIDYTYKVTADKLPPYYVKALEFFLASQFALSLTGDINKKTTMESSYIMQLKQAKFADSSQRPTSTWTANPYIAVRDIG